MLMPQQPSGVLVCIMRCFSQSMAPATHCNINNNGKEERQCAAFEPVFSAKNVASIRKAYPFFFKKKTVSDSWTGLSNSSSQACAASTAGLQTLTHSPITTTQLFFPTGSLLPINLPASHNVLSGWGHVNVGIKTKYMSTPVKRKTRQETWHK